jgi:hypothetical protein
VPFFAALTIIAVASIPASAIDNNRARGFDEDAPSENEDERPAGWRVLLHRWPLLVLAATAALFHFANAPILALASQKMALLNPGREAALTSAAIVVAQHSPCCLSRGAC